MNRLRYLPFLYIILVALAGCAPGEVSAPTATAPPDLLPTPTPVASITLPAATPTRLAPVSTGPPPATPEATAAPATTTLPPPTPLITPAPSPTPEPCAAPGRVATGLLDSVVAGEPMRYRVYLPPCYGQDGRVYPTLYMFGGNIHDDSIWDRLGLDEAAEALIAAGDIPPLLIVMPDNGWLANTTTSGPKSYEGFILNELIPHVEATYHAWPDRAGRAAGGLSRGGYWSLMMAFRRPDLFRSVGAHSPALIDSHAGPGTDPTLTGATNDLGDLRVWIDIGERDPYLVEARPLHEALAGAGVPHEWRVNEGTHEEAYWQANLDTYLAWYSDGWLDKGAP